MSVKFDVEFMRKLNDRINTLLDAGHRIYRKSSVDYRNGKGYYLETIENSSHVTRYYGTNMGLIALERYITDVEKDIATEADRQEKLRRIKSILTPEEQVILNVHDNPRSVGSQDQGQADA